MKAKKQFLAEIKKPVDQIDIELCALLFASEFQADLNVDAAISALDSQVNDFLDQHPDFNSEAPFNSAYLVGVVGEVLGYRGDNVEYYSPDNSLFNKVIDNRLGIPISLAAIYVSVGKRLGIRVHGVGFPGHFLLRITEPDDTKTLVDPFSHTIIDDKDMKRITENARQSYGGFDDRWLHNAHPHDMLLRMFENLKGVYLHLNEISQAQICLDYQLLLKPDDPGLLQQLQAFVDRTRNDETGSTPLN